MIKLTKEQKETLVRQGWLKIGNQILTRDLDTQVVEIYNTYTIPQLMKLKTLTRQSANPNISYKKYANIMTELDKLERQLGLYDTNNEKIGV